MPAAGAFRHELLLSLRAAVRDDHNPPPLAQRRKNLGLLGVRLLSFAFGLDDDRHTERGAPGEVRPSLAAVLQHAAAGAVGLAAMRPPKAE